MRKPPSESTVPTPPGPVVFAGELVDRTRMFHDMPLEEMRAKAALVHLYRRVWGVPAAQWVAPLLGFPVPPKRLVRHGAQLSLVLDG